MHVYTSMQAAQVVGQHASYANMAWHFYLRPVTPLRYIIILPLTSGFQELMIG